MESWECCLCIGIACKFGLYVVYFPCIYAKKIVGGPSFVFLWRMFFCFLSSEEDPVEILDRLVRRLRTKVIASVKVLWKKPYMEEATREAEDDMKFKYPFLYPFWMEMLKL